MRAAILIAVFVVAGTAGALARAHHSEYGSGGVPALNVQGSCVDAQKFSSGDNKNTAYKGCMQDEMAAKAQLDKRWSSFKSRDRQNCVEQARAPSPSYVEVLTCLEMDSDAMANAPRVDGKPVPQIGGPVAPGLPSSSDPATPPPAK